MFWLPFSPSKSSSSKTTYFYMKRLKPFIHRSMGEITYHKMDCSCYDIQDARWSFLLSPCGNPKQKGKLQAPETVIRVIQGFHNEGFLRAWENLNRFSLWLSFLSKCHLIIQTRKMPGMGGAIGVGIALGRTKNMVIFSTI